MCMPIPINLTFLFCLLVLIDYKGLWDVMVFFWDWPWEGRK